ncbi:MAG: DR2241 family protein [Luteolibacter sp.]|uniref:DR2241 family protein n=1 Tax=Luteolibacter sp. TaxID=1962973 RepID=UPI003263F545
MSIASQLRNLVKSGTHRMGELEIQTSVFNTSFILSHFADTETSTFPDFGGLEVHQGPADARDLSTYAEDGTYRFTKGQTNLKRGWVMLLDSEEDLRLALDQFYPAGVGLFLARQNGSLEVENLRDKLNRQTGMYRFARTISDAGAQKLIREVCGPAHQCAKKILWKLDANTPLEESEASRFNGIPGDLPENEAIPLLCREACNHFVAECRKTAKAESEAGK